MTDQPNEKTIDDVFMLGFLDGASGAMGDRDLNPVTGGTRLFAELAYASGYAFGANSRQNAILYRDTGQWREMVKTCAEIESEEDQCEPQS